MTLELLPPMYNHSTPLPTYSSKPSSNERTLHQTPSRSVRATPLGTYTHKTPKITVVLFDQELDVGLPIYGRNSQLSGYISVNDPRKVDSVVLKIEGKLSATTSERGSFSLPLLNCSSVLWRQNSGHELPKHLPFSQLLPSTFIYEGSEYPLPPTYSIPKTSDFCVRTKYSMKVCVNRIRGMGSLFAKSDSAKLSFQYRPRTRAHRPILPIPQFFSTVKTSPEEWYQKVVPIKTFNANPEPNALYCHLFIPEVRVFGLTDKIPFHVQINGPLEAIQRPGRL
ncbi:hypothetical protein H0H93_014846 [Arthromyces matolae]|nr:hypothetical protein H0H93_014846 [Arthromyces matolae]